MSAMTAMTAMTSSAWRRAAAVVCAVLVLGGCKTVEEEAPETGVEPAAVEPVKGSGGLSKVALTESAVERLALETVDVSGGPAGGTQIPYSAVMYDASGNTWAYVEVSPRVYLREAITVAEIRGEVASLTAGPPPGTPVVSVGAAELYGAEVGVDH
jgi:hypothetical protein